MKRVILLIVFLLFPSLLFAETLVVKIDGMTCDSCAESIQSGLSKLEQVENVRVSFSEKQALIDLKEGQDLSDQELKNLLEKLGYKAEQIKRAEK